MPDFVFNEKSLRFHIDRYVFTAKIREVIQAGWKEACQNDSGEEDGRDQEVPQFDEKSCLLDGLKILEKKTTPKKEFAIDTLLGFMEHPREENEKKLIGLGTPATRAEIIKTLFAREYIREEKKKLYATERGCYLLEQLSKNSELKKMTDTAQTTEWENRLTCDPKAFESEIADYITRCVKAGVTERAVFQKASLGACPLCKKPVIETKTGYGCSGYKDEPKCAFIIWKTVASAPVSPEDASLLLIGQKTKAKKCKNKDGKPFEAALVLEGGKTVFLFKK
jgi:DNA topoisomerase-3